MGDHQSTRRQESSVFQRKLSDSTPAEAKTAELLKNCAIEREDRNRTRSIKILLKKSEERPYYELMNAEM